MNLQRKLTLLLFITLFIPLSLQAQSEQLYGEIGDLKLESGKVIKNCRVGYRVYGSLKPDKSNVILFPTWFSGKSKDLAGSVGPKGLVDPSKFFVVTVDALGDGVSSSPSNSATQPNAKFPEFTIRDMVNAEHKLLTSVLGIHHIHAVMGISMGGMQTFAWIAQYPNFMDEAVPIVGSPRLTSYDKLLWTAELDAIEEGLKSGAPKRMISNTINEIHTMNLTTPDYRIDHTKTGNFTKFISKSDREFEPTFNPYDWASQLRAMLAQNIYKPFADSIQATANTIKAKVFMVVSMQDHMVNPHPALTLAPFIHARVMKLHTDCGHLGNGCKADKVNPAVRAFLEK